MMEDRMKLGEWLGLCKMKDGQARKVRGASSIAVRVYGEETAHLEFVLNYIKEHCS